MRCTPLLLATLASPMFVPVSCTTAMLPATHLLSQADTRDLARGAAPHLSPVWLPLVARDTPRLATTVSADEVDAALRRWPTLTARLPPDGQVSGPDKDRLAWRVLGDGADGQLVELRRAGLAYTHTLRYRAGDTGVVLLQSRLLSLRHIAQGLGIGLLFAGVFYGVMRVVRARRVPAAQR